MTPASAAGGSAPAADLSPFVPRLVPEWLAEAPGTSHRSVPGTLVFTDLSGFTAMSEKLAALGKVGAEELTQHLDATFSELVAVSGGLGGTLLKFGGDALLLFFWGDDHERRAAKAAVEMQDTLRRIGTILTTAGTFQLGMTVGVHCGEVDFFLVGSSHRELYVCGVDTTTTVETESSAESGEIRLSPRLAAALDPGLVDMSFDPPRLVASPDIPQAFTSMPPWPAGTSAWRFVPEMLRNHLRSGIQLQEHRQMTVGFVHLSNIDELLAQVGPKITGQHLHDLTAHIQAVFATHGVAFVSTDVYEGGPKIICAAGAVRTFGNDDESVLRTLREVVDYPTPIDLRVGINRGHGFCGYIGPMFRRTFAVIGDVVNTSARVMAKAGAREILSTAGTLERSDTTFEITELPPFAAKGKAEPLIAYKVGAVTGTKARDDRSLLPLIGRDAELERVVSALEDISDGAGRFLEIRGDAGIGKSRLVEELVARAELPVSVARCGRYAGSTPYFPFRTLIAELVGGDTVEALENRVREVAPDLVAYIPLLALVVGRTAPPTAETERLSSKDQRTKLHEVVAGLVQACSAQPRIWIVEDAHWMDAASGDLARHFAEHAATLPVLFCVSGRAENETFGGDEQLLELAPLDAEAAEQIVRAAATKHLLPRELNRLTERAHGNPYILIELAAAASADRDLEQLPDSLEALVAAKIDNLDPADKLVLRQLAVVGGRFDLEIAEQAVAGLPAPHDPRWAQLDEFVDRSEQPWRFKQTVIRDAAYEGLSYKERREVHARTGTAIEASVDDASMVCELLSLHFHAAGDHDKSLIYSMQAAEKAKAAFALAESSTFFRRSADAARDTGDERSLGLALTSLGLAELDQGHYIDARAPFEESLVVKRRLGDIQGVAAQLNGLGTVARQLGEYDKAQELFQESLGLLRELPDAINLGGVIRNIGTIALLRGDYPAARNWFEESLAAYEEEEDTSGVAATLETLGTVAFVMGDLDQATARYEQSIALQRERGDKHAVATGLNNLGNAAFQSGRLDEARVNYEESLSLRRELGDRYGVSSALTNLGTVAYFEHDYAASRASYEEALRIAREIGDMRGVSQCLHNLSEIAIIEHEPLEARGLCEEALKIRRELGDPRGVAESLTTLANLATDLGEHERGRPIQLEALEVLTELGNKPGLAECLEAIAVSCVALGDPTRAATLLGVVDAILEAAGSARTWSEDRRMTLEATLAAHLPSSAIQQAIDAGRAMTAEQGVDLARSFLTPNDEAKSASA